MKPEYYYLAMLGLTVLGALARYGWKATKFFLGMDATVRSTDVKVTTIMDNHLPHIYSRLGGLEAQLDNRQDSSGNTRRDREDSEQL